MRVKTVKTTTIVDVRLGVMNVLSLGNKLECIIDHITDNIIDIVGITETWHIYIYIYIYILYIYIYIYIYTVVTFYIITPEIKVKSRMICVNHEITSFESMELIITISSITIRHSICIVCRQCNQIMV